jgi:hypothetical protein
LFRLDLPDYVVAGACLAVTAGLTRLPQRGKALALAWLGGCVAWAGFLFWLLSGFAEGLQNVG